jgi:thiol-disulfide isomerase/thioredoxin
VIFAVKPLRQTLFRIFDKHMKHLIRITLILIALTSVVYAQTSTRVKDGLQLKVHVKGLTGGECLLANHYGDKQFIQDTAKVDMNGWMTFQDSTMPGGIYLVVLPSKKYFEVVLTDQQKFTVETDTTDMVKNMKITGNKENQYFYEYLNYMADQQKKIEPVQNLIKVTHSKDSLAKLQKQVSEVDSIVKNYKRAYYKTKHPETFMAEVLSAMDEPDQIPYSKCPKKADGTIDSTYNYWNFKHHYWDGMNFTDDRLVRTPVYHNKMKFYLEKLTSPEPDSIMAACDWLIEKTRPSKELFKYTVYYCTVTYETSKVMGYDAIFVHLVNKYYKTNQVWWVSKEQLKKIDDRADQLTYGLLGHTAVNISLKDSLGRMRTLQSVNAKYTVVVFWEPTCSHCKKEIPILKAYYDSLHAAGVSFEVYAVVTEMDKVAWKKYIHDNKITWINVASDDQKELATIKWYYDVYSTPTIYLLDEKKVIFGKRLDADGLKAFVNHRINEDRKKDQKPN